MSSKIRVKISATGLSERVAEPSFSAVLRTKIERDRVYYRTELKGSAIFSGSDYHAINDLSDGCRKIAFKIERYCSGGTWVVVFNGYFTKYDCKPDAYRCTVEATIKNDDVYDCIAGAWNEEVNIYAVGSTLVVYGTEGQYQHVGTCQFCSTYPPTPCLVPGSTAACIEYTSTADGNALICPDGQYLFQTSYHRIVGTGTPSTPPPYGSGWTYWYDSLWWRCPSGSAELNVGLLRYGRSFNAVLAHLVGQLGCGLTLRSHFFGINATHAAPPDNDAYAYALQNYQNITLHQKSDVKRPDGDPSLSFIWKMKHRETFDDLRTMFNVFWAVEGDDLILEHISYFEAQAGADYSSRKMPLITEYDQGEAKRERFKWMDDECSYKFAGQPIEYGCGGDEVERRVTRFSTDVAFIAFEDNQDKINDDGWVLLCTREIGGIRSIIEKNEPLAFENLHDKLHRHYRPYKTGKINGVDAEFESTIKLRRQDSFTVPLPCNEAFDPSQYITTKIGQGRVTQAEEHLLNCTLTLRLNYD